MYLWEKAIFWCLLKVYRAMSVFCLKCQFGLTFYFALSAFKRRKNAFFEKRMRFILFSVPLFIAFTKCGQWVAFVGGSPLGEVPYVFQFMVLCWVKGSFLTLTCALNVSSTWHAFFIFQLCQPQERELLAPCLNLATHIILLLTRHMTQSLEQIYKKKKNKQSTLVE